MQTFSNRTGQGRVATQISSGPPTLPRSRFPAFNKETFVRCKPDHLTAGNLEVGNLLAVLLKLFQETLLPNGWQMRATTVIPVKRMSQKVATTLSSHRLCLTLTMLASWCLFYNVSLTVVILKKKMFLTTYNCSSGRKAFAPAMISSTTGPLCAFFLGTPILQLQTQNRAMELLARTQKTLPDPALTDSPSPTSSANTIRNNQMSTGFPTPGL